MGNCGLLSQKVRCKYSLKASSRYSFATTERRNHCFPLHYEFSLHKVGLHMNVLDFLKCTLVASASYLCLSSYYQACLEFVLQWHPAAFCPCDVMLSVLC